MKRIRKDEQKLASHIEWKEFCKVEVKTASRRVFVKMTEFMFIRLNFFSILYLSIIQMSPLFTLQLTAMEILQLQMQTNI